MNPVLRLELRGRSRSWRAPALLALFVSFAGVISYLVYDTQRTQVSAPGAPVSATSVGVIGRSVFEWQSLLMLALVIFLVPGLLAGAVAGERERQTLVPLHLTQLRPREMLAGKAGAALATVAILVIAGLPIFAFSYLVGGVSLGDLAQSIAFTLATAVVLGCVTLWCSARARRVQTATVAAYGLVALMVGGSFLLYGAASSLDRGRGTDPVNPPRWLLATNPIAGLADLTDRRQSKFETQANSPLEAVREFLDQDTSNLDLPAAVPPGVNPRVFARQLGIQLPVRDRPRGGFWVPGAFTLTIVATVAFAAAARELRRVKASEI